MPLNSFKQLDSLQLKMESSEDDSGMEIVPNAVSAHEPSSSLLVNDAGNHSARASNGSAQRVEALRQTLERHKHERQLVILQDFPDPDALSCGWAYQLIAQQYDIQCDIVYAGTLSHQENIALVKLTGLPAVRWPVQTAKSKDLSVYKGYVLIDNQGTTSQLMPLVQEAVSPARASSQTPSVVGPREHGYQ